MKSKYLKNKISQSTIYLNYYIVLIPMVLFGLYKNGIKLYNLKVTRTYGMIKPLALSILSIFIGLLVELIHKKISKEKISIKELKKSKYPLYALLITSIISINTNTFLFIGLLFVLLFFSKYLKKYLINTPTLISLIMISVTNLVQGREYINLYESANKLTLEPLDYLIGRGPGGINSTCLILILISVLYLITKIYYKKDILFTVTSSYIVMLVSYVIFKQDINLLTTLVLSYNIPFLFVFLVPFNELSPYSSKGKLFYGSLIGVLSFILNLYIPIYGVLLAILIVSMFNKYFNKL